jgi:hypothetical protein
MSSNSQPSQDRPATRTATSVKSEPNLPDTRQAAPALSLVEGPLLVIWLPGAHPPSLNRTRGKHWSIKAGCRSCWSILIARSLCGLFGSAGGPWTTTISQAAAKNSAIQSLPLSGAAVILRQTVSSGSTPRNRANLARASNSRR